MEQYIEYDSIKFHLDARGYYTHHKVGTLHRYIWEEHNGKIPRGYVVHHKDEDKTNNDPDNLVAITDSEHKSLHAIGKCYALGYKHTDEAKRKIAASSKSRHHTKESKLKLSEAHKGRIFSEEHKRKLSEAKKGHTPVNKITTTQDMIDDKKNGMRRCDWMTKYKLSRQVWDRI